LTSKRGRDVSREDDLRNVRNVRKALRLTVVDGKAIAVQATKRFQPAGLNWLLPEEMADAVLRPRRFGSAGTKQGHRPLIELRATPGAAMRCVPRLGSRRTSLRQRQMLEMTRRYPRCSPRKPRSKRWADAETGATSASFQIGFNSLSGCHEHMVTASCRTRRQCRCLGRVFLWATDRRPKNLLYHGEAHAGRNSRKDQAAQSDSPPN
jgi:hypothetical protein